MHQIYTRKTHPLRMKPTVKQIVCRALVKVVIVVAAIATLVVVIVIIVVVVALAQFAKCQHLLTKTMLESRKNKQ